MKNVGVVGAGLLLPRGRVLGANDRIRVGIIGAGQRGRHVLNEFVAQKAELVAAADVFKAARDSVRKQAPAAVDFADHRRLLDRKDIDAVIMATPLHCHARQFVDTLAAGKDLYAEKTLAWSIAETDLCNRAALRHPRQVVTIGLQSQSAASTQKARAWLAEGLVGKVTHIESWMSRNTPRGTPQWVRKVPADCTPDNVRWDVFLNGRAARPFDAHRFVNWRLYWEFAGGNCAENMVHQVAWHMSLLELPVPSAAFMAGGVFSEKDGREVPDTIAVTFEFPELTLTWQSTFSNRRYGLGDRILGSHGTIERLQPSSDMVTSAEAGETFRYYPEQANRPGAEPQAADSAVADSTKEHVADFLACVRSRKVPAAPASLGYRSALAVHMANVSYRLKRRVTEAEARTAAPHGIGGEGGPVDRTI